MATEKLTCITCRAPKATLNCGLCEADICRNCVQQAPHGTFDFLTTKPAKLLHPSYCTICFDQEIAPEIETYEATLEKARNVGLWSNNYRGNVPVLKKSREPISAKDFADSEELTLQMGFLAAELGFNGLVDMKIKGRKVRNDGVKGYQTMLWDAEGWPVLVDEEKLSRNEFREAHWRQLHHR